ncbi:histidinol-phosphatase [Listeria ivanovii]|uniref:histidinol-phosphatase HisJ n=1 Tax=Listeria ivanovii TaxID=1638 RepID=UPI000DA93A45|nr:histidinol-phosphatase HisJ [Listeria ivanovii]PZG33232.1 histidinol-phosphatase [Listeria ivanovii]PZG47261.1 histidinol-phosphatase [Listeria ivanovii]PZH10883.1 histidinol-phosphatase [Listeria ivanovii]
MKRDGHTHTEFCPHGTREDVEEMILRAIELDFDEYSIVEHAPLPNEFIQETAGDEEAVETASMAFSDVPYYLKKMTHLKKKYARDLLIHIGFEVDYLIGYEDFTQDFLNEYGPQTDDGILSLHFLAGQGGYRSIDFSAEDYDTGIVQFYAGFEQAQLAYLEGIKQSIEVDLGNYKPTRIGHISLCQKFWQYFGPEKNLLSSEVKAQFQQVLSLVKKRGYELDFNTAGLFKPLCGETYPPKEIVLLANQLQIPFIYGSDSHGVQDVGRGYQVYCQK